MIDEIRPRKPVREAARVSDRHHDLGDKIRRLKFRFGFLLYPVGTPVNCSPIHGWNVLRMEGYLLHTHPDAAVRVIRSVDGIAVLVGDVFVAHGDQSIDEVACAMMAGTTFEAIDQLSGRFALVVFSASGAKVFHDAFSARTIFYRTSGSRAVASHSALLAEATGEATSFTMKEYLASPEHLAKRTRFLPGDLTMFDGIVALAANNYYDLASGRTVRYWPRTSPKRSRLTEFHRLVDEYFANYGAFLARTYSPVVGLTGGVDSRAVIAALRSSDLPLRLTTWNRLPVEENSVVRSMASHLRQPHSFLDVTFKSDDPSFELLRSAADVNTGFWRGRSYLTAQMAREAQPTDVFVRGLGGEILRGSYHSTQVRFDNADALRFFVQLYLTGRVKRPGREYLAMTTEAFRQFIDRANVSQATEMVDAGDLVYWEQRMSMWAANLHNELDPAMPSHTGFNSRPLFECAWGLRAEDRFGKELIRGIVARYDTYLAGL